MKRFFTLALFSLVAGVSYSQFADNSTGASVSDLDRRTLAKSSIDIPAWHEKSFWPLYENYLDKAEKATSLTHRAILALAKTDKTVSDQEALQYARQMLAGRNNQQTVRRQAYQEIANALNGIIALQFLQTEILLDMMESSSVYEETPLKKFRFHSKAMTTHQFKAARQNTIARALSLTEEEAGKFWIVYNQYVEECDATLGEEYSMISLYAGDASDFTPALAKRLGHEFLLVVDREAKLKEKYFEKMSVAAGPSLAARFLAWEDYYSVTSKMYAWAEAP